MTFNEYKQLAEKFNIQENIKYAVFADFEESEFEYVSYISIDDLNIKFYRDRSIAETLFINCFDIEEYTLCKLLRVLILCNIKNFTSFTIAKNLNDNKGLICGDHINFTGRNFLRGKNIEEFGPRFPDATKIYKNSFSEKLALEYGSVVCLGTFAGFPATFAEEEAYRRLGADVYCNKMIQLALTAAHADLPFTTIFFHYSDKSSPVIPKEYMIKFLKQR
ncbi:MAG: hypothetical protein JXR48_03630 [Candidatus Delongbacteria bacterium]|nr:hypothetical protein [Candidatus Delongbacteria bacterium]MBN2834037.1 hypothetical protein [Candidatus Delongbacteria bacterium]